MSFQEVSIQQVQHFWDQHPCDIRHSPFPLGTLEYFNRVEARKYFFVAARNDDYGGRFLNRMQIFIDSLLALWKEYHLNSEPVIVEWDPPPDKPSLRQVLVWPEYSNADSVCIIEVPAEVHHQLANSDKIPMFEYIAKNVGIRRALGEYVIVTNPDIIFSHSLVQFLSRVELLNNCFYRVSHYDAPIHDPSRNDTAEIEAFCRWHWFRVHTAQGVF